jgi:hypothetical protein
VPGVTTSNRRIPSQKQVKLGFLAGLRRILRLRGPRRRCHGGPEIAGISYIYGEQPDNDHRRNPDVTQSTRLNRAAGADPGSAISPMGLWLHPVPPHVLA